jgi:hypothetical protein
MGISIRSPARREGGHNLLYDIRSMQAIYTISLDISCVAVIACRPHMPGAAQPRRIEIFLVSDNDISVSGDRQCGAQSPAITAL